MLPRVLVIFGPTASGKTAAALHIARELGGEVINADARQVYTDMQIGTAKEMDPHIPHHCFNLVTPAQLCTVVEWKRQAEQAIDDVLAKGKLPIVVGGTGQYVVALMENYSPPQVPPQPQLRQAWESRTAEDLFRELQAKDPQTAARIDAHNKRRLIRALEVVTVTGKSFAELATSLPAKYRFLALTLARTKQELKERVTKRTEKMLAEGWIDEVKQLLQRYPENAPGLTATGYREVMKLLKGEQSLDATREHIVKETMDLVRRQITWEKKIPGLQSVQSTEEALQKAKQWYG